MNHLPLESRLLVASIAMRDNKECAPGEQPLYDLLIEAMGAVTTAKRATENAYLAGYVDGARGFSGGNVGLEQAAQQSWTLVELISRERDELAVMIESLRRQVDELKGREGNATG